MACVILYSFCSAFSLFIHQVLFSQECVRHLVQVADNHRRARVFHALHQLANGHWPLLFPHNALQQQYKGIIQVQKVQDLCLIWMVDVDHVTATQVMQLLS
jgi:hypothetical protein